MKDFSLLRVWFIMIVLTLITLAVLSAQKPVYGMANPDPSSQILMSEIIDLSSRPAPENNTLINDEKIKKIVIMKYYVDTQNNYFVMVDLKGRLYYEPAANLIVSDDGYTLIPLYGGRVYTVDPFFRYHVQSCSVFCVLVGGGGEDAEDLIMEHEEFVPDPYVDYVEDQVDWEGPQDGPTHDLTPDVDASTIDHQPAGVPWLDRLRLPDDMVDEDCYDCYVPQVNNDEHSFG